MPDAPLKVLLVEDNPADADLIEEALLDAEAGATFELVGATRLHAGLQRLAEGQIAVVLLDLSLPDSHGFETFTRMRAHTPSVPIVVLSGLDDQALADRAVREGAQDYLVKGQVDGNLLVRSLRYAIERKRAEEERGHLIREQAARAQASFLAEASKQLATTLDVEGILRNVAYLAVPTLADGCLVDALDEDNTVHRVAVARVEPGGRVVCRATEHRYHLDSRTVHPAADALRSGAPRVLDQSEGVWLEGLAADERAQPSSVMVVPLMARGRALGVLTFLYTVSGRRYEEADMALAEDLATRAALAVDNARLYTELQRQLRTRDEFLAAASHDLKNPLTSIRGVVQMLRRESKRVGAIDPARLEDRLTLIDTATKRMIDLVEELLDLARAQMGGQPSELEIQPVDLMALARQVVSEYAQSAERHQIRLTESAGEVHGRWDPRRLERVLSNLLANAIKYSPGGGEITVGIWRDSAEAQGDWVVLSVADQGLGIPAADLPRIFGRFHRAGNVVGSIGGTGLGLATARQFVEQHGGTISVESEEGVGSTFTVRLPLSPARHPAPAQPASHPA